MSYPVKRHREDDPRNDGNMRPMKRAATGSLTNSPAYSALSAPQRAFVDLVINNPKQNVFLTGEAGSGKSAALRVAIALLSRVPRRKVVVTASTGVAANDIQGTTVHRCLGLGIHGSTATHDAVTALAQEIVKKKHIVRERLRQMTDLVIDEISMLRARFIDNMDLLLRAVRAQPNVAFGGVRLILCGDFCQLPPVVTKEERAAMGPDEPLFAFQSAAWIAAKIDAHMLTFSHRHAASPEFAAMLSEMRMGCVSDATDAKLRQRAEAPLPPDDNSELVAHVYPMRRETEEINANRVQALPGTLHTFTAVKDLSPTMISYKIDPFSDLAAPTVLPLKENAQVMLLRNYVRPELEAMGCVVPDADKDVSKVLLCNGSVGRVLRFESDPQAPKSKHLLPVVCFPRRGLPSLTVRIQPHVYEHRDRPGGPVVATCSQLPLKLSYANTVHKSQGQTITCAVIGDLGSACSQHGQAYVLASRVRSLDQLFLRQYDREVFRTHPDVKAFYEALAGRGDK